MKSDNLGADNRHSLTHPFTHSVIVLTGKSKTYRAKENVPPTETSS